MLLRFENMEFDTANGEAYVNGHATNWYFEFVMQGLPSPGENIDTSRQFQMVTPWAYATVETANHIKNMMQQHTARRFTIEEGDKNTSFPTTHQQLHITAVEGGKKARVNAGLVAAQIARTTAVISDGTGGFRRVQNSAAAIAEALAAIEHELNG